MLELETCISTQSLPDYSRENVLSSLSLGQRFQGCCTVQTGGWTTAASRIVICKSSHSFSEGQLVKSWFIHSVFTTFTTYVPQGTQMSAMGSDKARGQATASNSRLFMPILRKTHRRTHTRTHTQLCAGNYHPHTVFLFYCFKLVWSLRIFMAFPSDFNCMGTDVKLISLEQINLRNLQKDMNLSTESLEK